MKYFKNTTKKTLKTIPFTTQKYKQMQEKVVELEETKQQVMQRLITAREMGDLSENGAYKYAKIELGTIRREIQKYKRLLDQGFVAPKHFGSKQYIDFGTTVTVQKYETQKLVTFMIVSEHESNPSQGKLSYSSPMGKVLIRKKVGDVVVIETPNGSAKYTIINVS